MKMKQMVTFILIIILNSLGCDTTEPPSDDLHPGRRDYGWTLDTLNSPNNTLYSILGASQMIFGFVYLEV